jgi:hypothetical protein
MKHLPCLFLLALAISCGCTTSDNHWAREPSKAKDSPWARMIPKVEFSGASLTNAVALIQDLANAQGRPEITLHIAKVFTTSEFGETLDDLNESRTMALELKYVNVRDVLRTVGALADHDVFFKGNEAVLAPRILDNRLVSITIEGHCRTHATGAGVGKLAIICTWLNATLSGEATVTSIHEIETRHDGAFTLSIPVPGYVYFVVPYYSLPGHPKPQRIAMIAIADDHYPVRFAVDLVESNLQYNVDIEMKK